ncbi:MAG TPA: hypothetical protein VJB37_01870 [Patescibacteria group bacterium]|nr:hypothetical protein [Patescibacteria group bacterium]
MKLSPLQKSILVRSLEKGGKLDRRQARTCYFGAGGAREKYQEQVITNSLERLIDRGLATGFGRRTPCKWFIISIRLTSRGRHQALKLLADRQAKLPLG